MTPAIPLPGVKTAIILIPVMMAMLVRRQTPALLVLAWGDLRQTAMTIIFVPMIRVIL
jgi:hypothetical protein